jgi:hypothetical protein
MTVVSAIITDAYRESNLIGVGRVPTDPQNTEGLTRLQSLIAGVYGHDVGERLEDWMVGYAGQQDPDHCWSANDWAYPLPNSRIILNHQNAETIYLPVVPDHGARISVVDVNSVLGTYNVTLMGNGRLIDGVASVVLNTNALNKTWVYNEDVSGWQALSTLALTDLLPFPVEFDDYFIITLAGRLNPRYGRSLSDLSLARLQELREQLEARYRQTRNMPAPNAVRRLQGPASQGYSPDVGGRSGRFGWMN